MIKGQQEDDDQRYVGCLHENLLNIFQVGYILVDQQIAVGGIAVYDRRNDGDDVFLEHIVISAYLVLGASALCRVKVLDDGRGERIGLLTGQN